MADNIFIGESYIYGRLYSDNSFFVTTDKFENNVRLSVQQGLVGACSL